MNPIVIEHVPVSELPLAWQAQLMQSTETHVTVRIEEEHAPLTATASAQAFVTDDPAFGIWRDHDKVADVPAYVRKLRTPRWARDGSRNDET
jgi:hypothetical protein